MYYATIKEMERLDALAVENGLEIRQMMELAGWHMVRVFRKLGIPQKAKVTVVCGKEIKGEMDYLPQDISLIISGRLR